MQRLEGAVTFGKLVKKHRLKNEFTLAELSGMTGLTAAAICQIENHDREPQLKTALKLIRKLQIPITHLMFLEDM